MSALLDFQEVLRSVGKLVLYIAILVAIWIGIGSVVGNLIAAWYPAMLAVPETDVRLLALNVAVQTIPAITALLIMSRFVDRVPVRVFGIALHDHWLRDLAVGFAVAVAMLVILLAGSILVGDVHIQWTASAISAGTLALWVGILLVAAAFEELVFRGYPLQILMKGIGPWPAAILMSIVFGLLHASNPGSTILGVLNTIIAGLMLSAAYMKTRSLWFPYAIHVGWNAGLGIILGFPVSGIHIPSFWTTLVDAREILLGGSYGPEGGVVGTCIFVAAAVAPQAIRAVRVSPQLRAAMAANAEKIYVSE